MEKKQGQLIKTITLTSATILVVSSVIGTGVYKKVAPMSAELMSPSLVLAAWVLAGVISLCGALSNAEIAGMLADSGGEYVYFKRIYGKFTAFLFGWKPTPAVLEKLKEAGYRWNPRDKVWVYPVRPEAARTTRIEAERLYQDVRGMIRQEKGIETGQEIPF